MLDSTNRNRIEGRYRLGKGAIDSDAQYSFGGDGGKSGEGQLEVLNLTPGDLQGCRISVGTSSRLQCSRVREALQKSAEVIVVVVLLRL